MAYEYYTRNQWRARPPTGLYQTVSFGNTGVVHHTAGTTDSSYELTGKPGPKWYQQYRKGVANRKTKRAINAYEKRKANVVVKERAAMQSWQRFHQSMGWTDIGYHRVIFPSGHVYEGRPWNTRGAHAINGNHWPGYSFAGNFEVQKPTNQALAAFREQARRDRVSSFIGHYRVPGNATSCPGKNLKQALEV